MKRRNKNFVFIMTMILFLSFWACKKIGEDVPEFDRSLLQSLNQSASPLTGADPTLPDTELAPLDDLGQALVVGLGEATHGTHEFFAMKHRLFRYLVERFDFRAFAFECDYGESLYFDRWVNGEAGELDSLMRKRMHFWTWRTIEVKALLEWMRQINLARPEAERLHYIGVDCQFATYQPDLMREYLKLVSPQHLAEIESLLVKEESFRDGNFEKLNTEQYQSLQKELESEYQAWAGLKNNFVLLSSPLEFEVARQLLRNLIQVNQVRFESTTSINYRDLYMTENTLWTQRNYGSGRGIALWAHNGHVGNDDSFSSMGYHLRSELGKQYIIVGFSFCQGSFNAVGYDPVSKNYTGLQTHSINTPPLADSLNALLFAADKKMFFLRLDHLTQGDPLLIWLRQNRKMLNIGAAYDGIPADYYRDISNIPLHYDVLIHFNQTTFAVQL